MIRNALMLLATLMVMACTGTPYEFAPAERAGMEARIERFEKDFVAGRTAAIVDVVPFKMTQVLAKRAGLPAATLRTETIRQTRATTRLVTIESFGMATDQATFWQTSSGRPYALIPTQTIVRLKSGQRIQSNNFTLAFKDAGKWYLLRVDEPTQKEVLIEAYPDFQGLQVSSGTTTVL